MAKVNRNQLKSIVKECLLELLSEGLASDHAPRQRKTRRRNPQSVAQVSQHPPANDRFDDAVNESVKSLTNDPIMSEIFADTARTTLQEQLGAESAGPMVTGGDSASLQMASAEPEDVFGDAASRWASLAFAEKGPTTE